MPWAHPTLGQAWRSAGSNCEVPCPQSQRDAGCPSPFLDNFLSCARGSGFGHHCFLFHRMVPEWNKKLPVARKLSCHLGGYFSLRVKVIVSHCLHPGMPASCLTGLSVSVSVAAWCIVSSRVEHRALSGQDLILGTCWGKGLSGDVPQGAPLTSSHVDWEFCSPRWACASRDYCLPQSTAKGDEPKRIIFLLKCLKTKVKKILLVMVFLCWINSSKNAV